MWKRNVSNTEKNIEHLNLVLIKNYLENRLDNKTRHSIERHLLDCEFCKEAFEGYQRIGTEGAEADVANIRRMLSGRVSKISSFFIAYRYYGIAASVLLLMASIFFVFEIGLEPGTGTVAQKEVTQPEASAVEEKNGPAFAYKNSADSMLVAQNMEEEKASEENKEETEVVQLSDSDIVDAAVATRPQLVASGQIAQIEEQPGETRDEEIQESQVQSALALAREIPTEPSDEGDFDVVDDISEVVEEEVFADATDEDLFLTAPNAETQAVSEELDNLSGAGSTSEKSARSLASKKQKLASTGAVVQVSSESEPQPIFGMEYYQVYLGKTLQYPEEAKKNKIEGEVSVRFTVGIDGRLSNFQIDNSLGNGCDEEAIRLIKEGDRWEPAMADGSPIEREFQLTISFGLEDR